MAPSYIEYRFSKAFKRLMYMAMWPPDMLTKKSHKRIFYVYASLWYGAMITSAILQLIDFYLVFGNFKKITFNLCSSTVIIGMSLKMFLLLGRRDKVRSLTYYLWEDSIKYNNEEDVRFLDEAYKRTTYIWKVLFSGISSVITTMGFFSYFSYKWGPRLLPFAAHLPMDDINCDATYVPALLFEVIMGFYTTVAIMESDLTMLSLVLQIQAHFDILCKNLIEIDGVGDGNENVMIGNQFRKEIDKQLRNDRILEKLKEYVKRHLELLKYCSDVEDIFNRCMVVQLLGGSFLILMNGVEATRHLGEINLQFCYQIIYVLTVMFDLYIICFHFTTLATACTNVGLAVYNSNWYNMDLRIKKMMCLILTRAQKAPRFTYGKLFVIDVNAYMHLVNNIYSWLMLFRQLEMK